MSGRCARIRLHHLVRRCSVLAPLRAARTTRRHFSCPPTDLAAPLTMSTSLSGITASLFYRNGEPSCKLKTLNKRLAVRTRLHSPNRKVAVATEEFTTLQLLAVLPADKSWLYDVVFVSAVSAKLGIIFVLYLFRDNIDVKCSSCAGCSLCFPSLMRH